MGLVTESTQIEQTKGCRGGSLSDSILCLKNVACLVFYNLKKLEVIFIIFGTLYTLIIIASYCMHNFPSRLSCDLTLPGNTLTAEHARCIPLWMRKCTAFRTL